MAHIRSGACAFAFAVGMTTQAYAAGPVFDVNSAADVPDAAYDGVCDTGGGVCTLRAAVMEANYYNSLNPGGEEATINLRAETYTLLRPIAPPDDVTTGSLKMTGNIRIVGKGWDLSIIDANHLDRAIFVTAGSAVTLTDLRVQGGRPPSDVSRPGAGDGAGIYAEGDLTLLRCLVRDNATPGYRAGGGILSWGTLTVTESVIRVNLAHTGGGVFSYGAASISRSTINANTAYGPGAGIFENSHDVSIVNSTITQNEAGGDGGGLVVANGAAYLNNVTALYNLADTLKVGGRGGGISYSSATVTLSNSVFENTLGDGSTSDDLADCSLSASTVVSNGYNHVNHPPDGACTIQGSWGYSSTHVGPFGFYGGATATYPLLPGSDNAIDGGDPSGCLDPLGAPLTTDQRGVHRPIGAHCDLGAFEVEPIGDANGDGNIDVLDVFYLINYLFAGGPVPKGRADVNADATIDVLDVFYLINYLFAGGPAPK